MKHSQSEVVIYVTRNYNSFKTHDLQPEKRIGALSALEKSIKFTNGNSLGPIIVNEKTMQIIEGHRRAAVAAITGTPLYYILINEDNDEELMRLINASSVNWTTPKFINHYAKRDEGYAKLEEFLKLKGATFEMVKKFSEVTQDGTRAGIDISDLDYEELEKIRVVGEFIAGMFMIQITVVYRAMEALNKKHKNKLDIELLTIKVKKDREKGLYANVMFVATVKALTEVLDKTYQRK